MLALCKTARCFVTDEDGATAIEYGLIAGLITVAILIALTALNGNVSTMFDGISSTAGNALDNIEDLPDPEDA